jgi:phosphatidylinositol-bisphosphatase
MDCLDRTNNVQAYIGLEMLDYQLKSFLQQSDTQKIRECRELYRQMWILNGDCISKIYAGTGAIQGKSMTQDIGRSLTRAIQNNFLDNSKQDAIDTVLYGASKSYGDLADRIKILMSQNALRLPYQVLRRMISLNQEYSKKIRCKVCVATWNINGGLSATEMENLDLNDWLIGGPRVARKTGCGFVDPGAQSLEDIDIFCVGFEEIVDLTATNIVKASEDNSNMWYSKLYKFLQRHGKYVPLIIEPLQLVGVCIFVFVAEKHISAIRDVSISKTKTGLGGAAGNKVRYILNVGHFFIYCR